MPFSAKFMIKGLRTEAPFADSRQSVLAHYLKRLTRLAEKYLQAPSEPGLHDLRIALRRFRYVLELYAGTIKPRHFKKAYKIAVSLQDLLGSRRDVDVILARLDTLNGETHVPIPTEYLHKLETERSELDSAIRKNLETSLGHRHLRRVV